MKRLHTPLLLGALTLPLACAAVAAPQAWTDSQGQDPAIVADQFAQRIRGYEGEIAGDSRTAGLLGIADEAAVLASRLDPASALWRRVQADRLYALALAGRDQDVVATYRTMQAHGAEPPSYVIAVIAQALSSTGESGEAGQLLQRASIAAPANPALAIRYAYLLMDQGRYDAAIQHLDQWIANARRQGLDGTPALADAQLALARTQRWDERFDTAERTLAQIDASQAVDAVAAERATLQRQRGRPRAAIGLLEGADDRDARGTRALAWMDLGRPDRARDALGTDGDPALGERISTSLRSRGLVSARYGQSRSAAIASPNAVQESAISLRIDGPWLGSGWRIGGHVADQRAEFKSARPESRYAGVRLIRATTGGETTLEAGRSFDDFLSQTYAIVDSSTWIDDHLRLGGRLAINDPESSLQARASGIGSDAVGVSGTYRPSERWRIDAGINAARFDDGNRRWSISFGGESRLHAAVGSITSGFAGVYASRNSRDDAPYFNPRRDASLEVGVVHGFRGLANSWHTLRPSVVQYWQDGFGGHLVPRLGYSARFDTGAGRRWQVDLGAARPVYDGQRETQWTVSINYGWGD